jgi:hypothetical protein
VWINTQIIYMMQEKNKHIDNYFKNSLNYNEIRSRIEIDKDLFSNSGKEWANYIGVEESVVSNFHRKKNPRNPSFEYILAVAYKTQKPVEWYLYGDTRRMNDKPVDTPLPEGNNVHAFVPQAVREIFESDDESLKKSLIAHVEYLKSQAAVLKKQNEQFEEMKALLKESISDKSRGKAGCKKNSINQTDAHTIDDDLDKVMEK